MSFEAFGRWSFVLILGEAFQEEVVRFCGKVNVGGNRWYNCAATNLKQSII